MIEPAAADDNLAGILLALPPERFAREARALVDTLSDHERGLLASAVVAAHEALAGPFGPLVAALGLDSADPSLMSRADVARVLASIQREHPETLRQALRDLRDHPRLIHLLGAPFAPLPEASDTSRIARVEE